MSLLVDWKPADFDALESKILLARHRLADSGLFSDEGLAEILDRHPDSAMTLATMGDDCATFEWSDGQRGEASGSELLELVMRGKLWINCKRLVEFQPEIAKLVDQVYSELESGKPGFRAEDRTANLLISSPTAMVHYHVDMPVNMLWHLRGRKRVWVYPPFDERFASLPVLENVCTGLWSEDIPYRSEWDEHAEVFDAEPGQLITWPQLTPHRVSNLEGLNVSLSTEHKNARARRRLNVHQANHLLRDRFGLSPQSASADGLAAHAKQTFARLARYANKFRGKAPAQFEYPKRFVVDLTTPSGIRFLDDQPAPVAPHLEYELQAS